MSARVLGRINSNPPGYLIVGAPDGVASLDDTGKVPLDQTPDLSGSFVTRTAGDTATVAPQPIINVADFTTPQDALDHTPAGSRVRFPAATYTVPTGGYVMKSSNLHIDAPLATFQVADWGTPAFLALRSNSAGDGHTFDLGTVQYTGTRGNHTGSLRGSALYCSGCAVWVNGDRNYVRQVRTIGMPTPIFFSSYDGTSAFDRVGIANRVGRLECEGYDFGILYVGQQDLQIDYVYGHDDTDDSAGANPTHVIYCSATTSFRASGTRIGSVQARNHINGHPVILKFCDDTDVTLIKSYSSEGGLYFIDANDLSVGELHVVNASLIAALPGAGALGNSVSVSYPLRFRLGRCFIQLAAGVNDRAINLLVNDSVIGDTTVMVSHTATTDNDVIIRGSNNRLKAPTIRSRGAVHANPISLGYSATTATFTTIEDPVLEGHTTGITVVAGSTGAVMYQPSAQQLSGGPAFVSGAGASGIAVSAVTSASTPVQTFLSTLGDQVGNVSSLTTTTAVAAINGAQQVRFTPKRNIVLAKLEWFVGVQSGNYDLAVVDHASGTVLWSKGSTACPVAGPVTETLGSPITLLAGTTYRIAFAADNTTLTFRGVAASDPAMLTLLDGTTACHFTSAAFPLPTPLSFGASVSGRVPLVLLREA